MLKRILVLGALSLCQLSFASEKTFTVHLTNEAGVSVKIKMPLSEMRSRIAAGELSFFGTKINPDQMDNFINYITTAEKSISREDWDIHQLSFNSLSIDSAKK